MRINFNSKTRNSGEIHKWMFELRETWLLEYDIDITYNNPWVVEYTWSPNGAQNFAFWLKNKGFKVDYWEVDYLNYDTKIPVAYGLEFDETCPKFVFEQLRCEGINELV